MSAQRKAVHIVIRREAVRLVSEEGVCTHSDLRKYATSGGSVDSQLGIVREALKPLLAGKHFAVRRTTRRNLKAHAFSPMTRVNEYRAGPRFEEWKEIEV